MSIEVPEVGAWLDKRRWVAAAPFGLTGTVCIIGGGLLAAITAHAPSEHSSWAAAYLVLVGGVAQIGLGFGSAALAPSIPSRRARIGIFALWNIGNALVMAGVLVSLNVLVDAGGIALVIALVLALRTIRHSTGPALLRRSYWLLAIILGLSIPTGLMLTRIRGG
jgi:hypothetical protein